MSYDTAGRVSGRQEEELLQPRKQSHSLWRIKNWIPTLSLLHPTAHFTGTSPSAERQDSGQDEPICHHQGVMEYSTTKGSTRGKGRKEGKMVRHPCPLKPWGLLPYTHPGNSPSPTRVLGSTQRGCLIEVW